jgi:hypothetical protein
VLHNNTPPESVADSGHSATGPRRSTHERPATPIAPSASANTLPAGPIGESSASNANAHAVKCARILSAPAPNRRSHPRTVSFGNPSAAAIGR